MAIKVCRYCGKTFNSYGATAYCSPECRNAVAKKRQQERDDYGVKSAAELEKLGLARISTIIAIDTKVELEKAAIKEGCSVREIVTRILEIGISLNTYSDISASDMMIEGL